MVYVVRVAGKGDGRKKQNVTREFNIPPKPSVKFFTKKKKNKADSLQKLQKRRQRKIIETSREPKYRSIFMQMIYSV